jgi:hypothetical protein
VAQKKADTGEIFIPKLTQVGVKIRIIGQTPLFQNRMSNKVKQTLLVGGRKKTQADRVQIKHDPYTEFLDSAERMSDGPTALGMRVTAIKGAMCTAALETAGITKSSAQRLIFMPGDLVPLYGTPQLRMDVVRSADINRTPDVRSRCYLPQWGVEFEVRYITPQLSAASIASLLVNAGVLVGVGDFRQEKGKGGFGAFRVLGDGEDDAEWNELIKKHGRAAQLKALKTPEYANEDTIELMNFFESEKKRRAA